MVEIGLEDDEFSEDLVEALAADGGTSIQSFSIYVPDKDRDGNEIGN